MGYSKSIEKTNQTYQFIKDFIAANNYPPSVREICAVVGFKSTASAQYYLDKLAEMGLIRKCASKNRTIEVVERAPAIQILPQTAVTETNGFDFHEDAVRVPFLGNVAAGQPLFADVAVGESYYVPKDFFALKRNSFLLKVKGESMIDIGIFDGDVVLVEQSEDAHDGDIVVAQLDGNEVTLKRFYRRPGHILLHPENATMQDIVVLPDRDLRILGIAKGLMRNAIR